VEEKMKTQWNKLFLALTAILCCFFVSVQGAKAAEATDEGVTLTVYMKNDAAWDIINIYAWDDYDGAATDMEWTETPMEDMGNGWMKYTLTSYKDFYLCFQDGGSVWTNDVPVQEGVSEVYLDLTATLKGEKQVCQFTEERPGDDVEVAQEATTAESGLGSITVMVIVFVVVLAVTIAGCAVVVSKKKKTIPNR